jgi:DNA primase
MRSIGRITARSQKLPALSEELISHYAEARDDYFVKLGFSPETMEVFEIGFMLDREGVPRATIPIRDVSGTLVSMSGRRTDNDEDPRYCLEYESQKGRVLYNLHRAINSGSDTIILVEGFKALWSVYEAGFGNVAACMGTSITDEQVWLLCATGFRNCILMFDGDKSGLQGIPAAERKLRNAFNVVTIYLPEGKSPDSFDRDELKELLDLYLASF